MVHYLEASSLVLEIQFGFRSDIPWTSLAQADLGHNVTSLFLDMSLCSYSSIETLYPMTL